MGKKGGELIFEVARPERAEIDPSTTSKRREKRNNMKIAKLAR